jgi:hypothetical protein
MRRLFWLALGVTVGVLVMRKMSKMAQRLTPRGVADTLADALGELGEALREFGGDVRAATTARESELRAAIETDGHLGKPER